jgi:hypothetical protein
MCFSAASRGKMTAVQSMPRGGRGVLDDATASDPLQVARRIGSELAPEVRRHLVEALHLAAADGAVPREAPRHVLTEALHCIELLEAQVSQLETALQSRIVIEQAKGILAARTGEPVDEMFEVLRTRSQLQNRKLRDIAAEVVRSLRDEPAADGS